MPETSTVMRRSWVLWILIPMVALVAYWQTFEADFVWDDRSFLVEEGRWILEGNDWWRRSFDEIFVLQGDRNELSTNYFRPLVMLGFVAQMRLSGGDPGLLHAMSLLIHVVNSLLVAGLATAWYRRRDFHSGVAAPLAGLIYAIHPALVESVAWIACQFDLLTTTFTLLALIADRFIVSRAIRALVVSALFLLIALCKETAVAFPLLLLVAQWSMSDRKLSLNRSFVGLLRANAWTYVGIFAAGVFYLWLRWISMGHVLAPNSGMPPLSARIHMFGLSYLQYWRLALAPFFDLTPLHEVDPMTFSAPNAQTWMRTVFAFAVLTASLLLALVRHPFGRAAGLFTLALIPVVHFIPMTIGLNVYQERMLALPVAVLAAAGIPLLVGVGRDLVARAAPARLSMFAIALWLMASGFTTWSQVPIWSSDYSLWLWTYKKNPSSVMATNNLIGNLMSTRRDDKTLDEVMASLEHRKDVAPTNAANLASYYISKGRYEDAIPIVQQVLKLAPQRSRLENVAMLHYGAILGYTGEADTAVLVFRELVERQPDDVDFRTHYAWSLHKAGDKAAAEESARLAIELASPIERDRVRGRLASLFAH